jgi:hypothetical protein
LARVEERADRLSMYATLCDDPGLINTLLPRYLSVTAEQIRDAARDVFRADNRVVLTYVPQAGIATTEEAHDRDRAHRRASPSRASRGPTTSRSPHASSLPTACESS